MSQPGYLLVLGHSLDRDKMAVYSAALPPIYQTHGGYYLAMGGPGRGVDLLSGNWQGRSGVIARFGARPSVSAFWYSPEYTKAKDLRKGGGTFDVFALQGLADPPAGQSGYLVFLHADDGAREAWRDAERARAGAAGLRVLVDAAPGEIERLEGSAGPQAIMILAARDVDAARSYWPQSASVQAAPGALNAFLVAGLPPRTG
jgi:uncharacterized protein (DUF1330 family)